MTGIDFFSGNLMHALGWTLLHSLWQGMAIWLIVLLVLRLVSPALSHTRYAVACGGLFMSAIVSAATFVLLLPAPADRLESGAIAWEARLAAPGDRDLFSMFASSVESHLNLLVTAWAIGLIFFGGRLLGGYLFTRRLRATAKFLTGTWSNYIGTVARKWNIRRTVRLAESPLVSVPIVLGYCKPVIIIPMGLLTGLSSEQLETIFLHELAHIRRHDFLINLIQAIWETIFFFNPFVRSLSSHIRRERECCCDDVVVQQHHAAMAYARALTALEEVRFAGNSFALSLAQNKNHLMQRIRRIMETSARKSPERNRLLVPAILLVAGLLCISWLGAYQQTNDPADTTNADTTVRNKIQSARMSKKTIVTYDANGTPHEEVITVFEGDESLKALMDKFRPADLPPVPDVPPLPGPMPGVPDGWHDSIPPPGFGLHDGAQWDAFSKAFAEEFRARFEDFYASNRQDIDKLMETLQKKFELQGWPGADFGLSEEAFEKSLRAHEEALEHSMRAQEEAWKAMEQHEEHQQRMQEFQQKLEDFQHLQLEGMEKMWDSELLHHEKRFREYEKVLQEELVRDGYLNSGESLESMEWGDDVYKVNGKKISDAHRQKYRELHDKYLGDGIHLRKIE